MPKITFLGAGSTIFTRNVLGDCMVAESIKDLDIALYDINSEGLEESYQFITAYSEKLTGGKAKVSKYLGVENRRDALRGADFVINAIQVGGYKPSTVIDFEIPKKYGLRQTIGDTLGIGGIFRGLRTIPVLRDFAEDIMAVCPNALLMNYTNPMAILTGYLQRFTDVKTVGLCHSVQYCSRSILDSVGLKDTEVGRELIAGINHMAWLLEVYDKNGNDLYPAIRKAATEKIGGVRTEYIRRLGYFCTESSEHNAEYNPFFIKGRYPELIEKYKIPLDEYPRRCENQIKEWKEKSEQMKQGIVVEHKRSREYASRIIEAIINNKPDQIGGNVINNGLIPNLPPKACVEVPCLINGMGVNPTYVGELPTQLAAMNITNINPQLLTIEAAVTKNRDTVYQAAMLDPHTAAELSIDDIVSMCDELLEAHKESGFPCLV